MLNISLNRVDGKIFKEKYKSFKILGEKASKSYMIKVLSGITLVAFGALFLPWTQNIRSKGYVTTLSPNDRPQSVQALIGGKIEQWYVQEGDTVKRGDTIIMISEVKEEYLDPQLLDRTQGQINAKKDASISYNEKAASLQSQYQALVKNRSIKLEMNAIKIQQTKLKLQSDSMDLVAAKLKEEIAQKQLNRQDELFNDGLASLTDLETKRLSFQEAQAKVISLQNKVNAARNELLNLQANMLSIQNEFQDKIAKSRSDMMSALSDKFDTDAQVDKLQSQYNAYSVRRDNYFIKSPINGIVTQAIQSGIGEIIKNGEDVVTIMPVDYQLAVETFVDPMDMPLLRKGVDVRVQFDGWPAIVFSGWPNSSYGTFGGKIFAIDNFISDNGKYRILIEPDNSDHPWPDEVRVGGGANTITLLTNVSVGYELWRQLNGFPPDYYKIEKREEVKSKAPLRKVK